MFQKLRHVSGKYIFKMIPQYYLLIVKGTALEDDFGLNVSMGLVLSTKAVRFLQGYTLADAKMEELTP